MSLDIVIERPAAQKVPEKSVELALVRLPGASMSRTLNSYSGNEGEDETAKKEPLDAWFITDRLHDILADADAIFVDDEDAAKVELRNRYGSVEETLINHYSWLGGGVDGRYPSKKVFVCMHGVDSGISRAQMLRHAKEEGPIDFLMNSHSNETLEHIDRNVLHRCSYHGTNTVVIEDDVYLRSKYVSIAFEESRFTKATHYGTSLMHIRVFHDPKKARRQASARKSMEKRKLTAPPTRRVVDALISRFSHLGEVEDTVLYMSCRNSGYKPDLEAAYSVLARLVEMQIALGLPYREDLYTAQTIQIIKLALVSEAGMQRNEVLAPLVPWLKTELVWLNKQHAKEES